MAGFVYIWYDRKHKRYYVGSHWGTTDDGYICSSRWMRKAYARRPEDFKRRIISEIETSRYDLLVEEQRWLNMMKDEEMKGPRYYNMRKRADHLWHAQSDQKLMTISEKISVATKAAMNTQEGRQKNLEGQARRDKSWTDERRERQRKTMIETMAKKFKPEDRKVQKHFGRYWWNNGVIETKSPIAPEGFVRGRLPSVGQKISATKVSG